jgi:hypothetical protein
MDADVLAGKTEDQLTLGRRGQSAQEQYETALVIGDRD